MTSRLSSLCAAAALFAGSFSTAATSAWAAPHGTAAHSARVSSAGHAYASGLAALRSGQYSTAEKFFRSAIAAHDHTLQAYGGLGTAAVGLRDFKTAFSAYQKGADLAPKNPLFQYRAGFAALYAGDFHQAVTYAGRFIALRPRDPSGYHLRFLAYGDLLDGKKQLPDAQAEAILQRNNPAALNDLGIAFSNNQKWKQAIAALTQAIKLDPKNGAYWSNRGQAEYQFKQYRAAIADFQRAMTLTSDAKRRQVLAAVIKAIKKQKHL